MTEEEKKELEAYRRSEPEKAKIIDKAAKKAREFLSADPEWACNPRQILFHQIFRMLDEENVNFNTPLNLQQILRIYTPVILEGIIIPQERKIDSKEREVIDVTPPRPKDWEPITHTITKIYTNDLTNLRDENEEIRKDRAEKTKKE